jgi:hypothetical protein
VTQKLAVFRQSLLVEQESSAVDDKRPIATILKRTEERRVAVKLKEKSNSERQKNLFGAENNLQFNRKSAVI